MRIRTIPSEFAAGLILALTIFPSPALAQSTATDPLQAILQTCIPQGPKLQPMIRSAAVGTLSTASGGTSTGSSTANSGSDSSYERSARSCQIRDCRPEYAEQVLLMLGSCDKYGYGTSQWQICVEWTFMSSWRTLMMQFDGMSSTVTDFGGCQGYNRQIGIDHYRIDSQFKCLSGALNQVGTAYATSTVTAFNDGSLGPMEKFILSTLNDSEVACGASSSSSSSSSGSPSTINFGSSSSSSGGSGSSSSSGSITINPPVIPPGTVCPAWGCDGPPGIQQPVQFPIATPTPTPLPTQTPEPILNPIGRPTPVGPEPVRSAPALYNGN